MKRLCKWLMAASLAAGGASAALAADWPTHRGNPQRTGSIDDKPGPKSPKVLWVYNSQEHFLASPAMGDKELIVSGMGGFGTAALHALSIEDAPAQREKWSKKPPFLKLPVVCPPAIAEGRMVFGDGMHQTDGATLYCLLADSGTPLWQFPVPGALVHMEGAPTIAGGKVFIGGGNAGVLCIDPSRISLDGKEMDPAAIQRQIETKWKEMLAKYEAEKKKDPDFAIPPSESALPKPQPKKLWQAGANQWHVDSALAVVGDRVLAASARLDLEKVGDRAVFCMDAATGQIKWRAPLALNPWAGPTVAGNVVLLGCSGIRFDPKEIPGAKGEVVALNLEDGKVLWRTPVSGGVVSPVAAVGDLAVFTATDGKVRALNMKDGSEKWAYDAKAPFFAGPAVAGGSVYVADLKNVVHAVSLAGGQPLWSLDLTRDPAIKAPGMIYGSPIVHAGRLYVGTTDMDSSDQTKTVVICIGEK